MAPQTWHYGLVAKWWAEFNEGGPEIEYFRRFIEDDGQPALDVACGTGRHAIELTRRGYKVVGFDLSLAALAIKPSSTTRPLRPSIFTRRRELVSDTTSQASPQ